jgi:ATP-dependent exoDNAse (exonuclease V) beta subunit
VRFNLELDASRLYARHEGGMGSRALGTAVHTFFEELARLRAHHDWETARADLKVFEPRIAAAIRSAGIGLQQATQIASEALQLVLEASRTAVGQWILSPHAEAASEVRWSGVIGGVVRTVQADRIFKAGLIPHAEGDASWWIIDYKTHAAESGTEAAAALPPLRSLFAPQLEAYARVLRNLHGEKTALRAGLYYPRMNLFDWWQL